MRRWIRIIRYTTNEPNWNLQCEWKIPNQMSNQSNQHIPTIIHHHIHSISHAHNTCAPLTYPNKMAAGLRSSYSWKYTDATASITTTRIRRITSTLNPRELGAMLTLFGQICAAMTGWQRTVDEGMRRCGCPMAGMTRTATNNEDETTEMPTQKLCPICTAKIHEHGRQGGAKRGWTSIEL